VGGVFDYAACMRSLIEDIVSCCEVFGHIDMSSVLVGCIKARKSGNTGLYARTVPLRFENGSFMATRRGCVYRVPRVIHEGNEILYIISFCLPRFQDLSFEGKITTIFHELYHISPRFDGDIRRFRGKNYVHGSQKKYDELVKTFAQEYMAGQSHSGLIGFLKLSWEELSREHGAIRWTIYRAPKPELIEPEAIRATARRGRKGKRR